MKHESPACVVEGRQDGLSEEEFGKSRLSGLGGSDAGAIMGLSQYATPMTVVAGKLGLIKGFEGNDATKRGKRLEPVIRTFLAQWYEEEFGIKIKVFSSPFLYRSTKYPWMIANIDGLIEHPEYGLCVLEIKTGNDRQGENWEDDSVPDAYYAQGQHYDAVLDLPMTIYAGLIGLNIEFRHSRANPEFQAKMIEAERIIWQDFVLKGLLPAPTGHDKEDDVVKSMYNQPNKSAVDLSGMKEHAARHVAVSAAIKDLEAEKKKLAAEIKLALGNANIGMMPGYKATWSRFTTSRFDKDLFGKEHPELLAKYTSEEDSSRFTVTATR